MRATFFERVGAYLIDIIIVSIILNIICLGFNNYTSSTEKKIEDLDNKFLESEITNEEYLNEYKELLYDYQKENTLQSGISVALTIAYFVVFQYMNKGQTIGKKLLKIKVVDKTSNKEISIIKGLLRSCIILSIISNLILLLIPYILNANVFIYSYLILIVLDGILVLTSAMFILYRKDNCGLHDLLTNTIVIKQN